MSRHTEELEAIAVELRPHFAAEDEARERALRTCRQVVRHSADAIRAVHRQQPESARQLIVSAGTLLREVDSDLAAHGKLHHSGYVHDAQKEFAEACLTVALITGEELPRPGTLGISPAAYLDGLGESVGELRRYILDSLRRDDFSRCEELLTVMDQIYAILMTMDFPELLAHGLRRTTDSLRGIIERTRGDLTLSLRQKRLEERLRDLG
jgi:translin